MKKLSQVFDLLLSIIIPIIALSACSGKPVSSDPGSVESTVSTAEQSDNSTSDTSETEIELTTASQTGETTATRSNSAGSTTAEKIYVLKTEQEKKFASIKGKTLNIMVQKSRLDESEIDLAQLMKDKYGVTIKHTILGWLEMQQNIAALVAAGNPPDYARFSDVLAMRYAYSNLAQPIDSYIVKSDGVWKNGNTLETFSIGNKTVGIADYMDHVYYVYYNKTLFEELHVKDPYEYYKEGKWDFENFRKTAKAVTVKEDSKVKTYGVATWNPTVFIMANGGTGIAVNNGKWSVTIGNKAEMNALQLISDMIAENNYGFIDGYKEFYSRECAMFIERPWTAIGVYDYYNRMKDKIGMVPMPKGPDADKYYAPATYDGMFVPLNAKNPLGAIAYQYESRKRAQDSEKSSDPELVKLRRKTMSDEHRAIRDEYRSKATVITTNMDGLAGWWDGEQARLAFWNKFVVDKMQPAQAVDSLSSLMKNSLKKTVGSVNVK